MNRNLFFPQRFITQNWGLSQGTSRERQFNVVLGGRLRLDPEADSIGCSGLPWGTMEKSRLRGGYIFLPMPTGRRVPACTVRDPGKGRTISSRRTVRRDGCPANASRGLTVSGIRFQPQATCEEKIALKVAKKWPS